MRRQAIEDVIKLIRENQKVYLSTTYIDEEVDALVGTYLNWKLSCLILDIRRSMLR